MKKILLAFLFPVLITACATLTQPWIGKNFDEYMMRYGAPDSSFQTQNGYTIHSFIKACAGSAQQEEKLVTVARDNTITQTAWKSFCPSNSSGSSYSLNSPGRTDDINVQKTTDASFDDVWNYILLFARKYNLALTSTDKRSGSINTETKTDISVINWGAQSAAQCDLSFSYSNYRRSYNILVIKNGNSVIVHPAARFEAYNNSLGWVPCASTGKVEQALFDSISVDSNFKIKFN